VGGLSSLLQLRVGEPLDRQAALVGTKQILRIRSAPELPLSSPSSARDKVHFLIPSTPGACSRGHFRPAQDYFGKAPAAYSA